MSKGGQEGEVQPQGTDDEERTCKPRGRMRREIAWWPVSYLILLLIVPLAYGWLGAHHRLPNYLSHPLAPMPLTIVWFGTLGGVLISLQGIFFHNADWNESYELWHRFSGIVGASYAIFGYYALTFLLRSATHGSITSTGTTELDLAAFVLGYSQNQFHGLLQKVSSTIFGPGPDQKPGVTYKTNSPESKGDEPSTT